MAETTRGYAPHASSLLRVDEFTPRLQWWVEPYYRGDLQCLWTIRSFSTGKYLGFEGFPSNGTQIVAVNAPQPWALYSPDVMDTTKFG
jgi:hypothetical protein